MVWISMTYLLCTVKQHKKENGNLYLRSKDNQGTSPEAIEKNTLQTRIYKVYL